MPNGQSENFLQPEEKGFQSFYKREMWWLEHRILLGKLALGLFIIFDAVLISFAGWRFLDAFVISREGENKAVAALVKSGQAELRSFSVSMAAEPMSVSETEIVASGDGKNYDLFAEVTNENIDWYVTFKYAFKFKDGETAEADGFVLPNETRPLVVFKATGSRPAAVDLVLREIEWHRVDPRSINDYSIWFSEHTLLVSDAAFSRGDETVLPAVSFLAKNASAYNYWQPSFLVVLRRGSSVGGLTRVTVSDLESGEEKILSTRWIGAVPAVSKVEVFQEINFFASEAYSSPEGIQSGDVRTRIEVR